MLRALALLLLLDMVLCASALPAAAAAAGPATAADDALLAEAPRGRLPAGVTPRAYRLDLTVDPRQSGFGGNVAIDVELAAPADRIWLHGQDLVVNELTAVTAAGNTVRGSYREMAEPGVSVALFEETLPAGKATLRIAYAGAFDRNLAGLFKVEEQGRPYVLAKSESIQARSYLPGFDEPGLKATFDISLTIPRGFEAIGNEPVVAREPAGDGMERVRFATTRPMPTYLLSLAVGPFDIVERPPLAANPVRKDAVPLRGVSRAGRGGAMNYVLDVTPRMLEIFEEQLRRPYPFRKLDIVAAPQWPSGATELSAAITYREQRILVGDHPAPGARLSLLGVHAHELAHMWFGNLVTPPWWDDLWLKEGFATWATPLVLTILEPEGGHDLNGAARAIRAMRLDSLASTRAIREPIEDNNDIRNAYDAITYAKSLGVIHMVDQYFGPDRFRPALGRYVASYADGVADSADFYRVIGEETGEPGLTETFRSFVEQTGVPVIDARVECTGGEGPVVHLRQSRYRPLGSRIDDADKLWTIPVCLDSGGPRQCLLMQGRKETVALEAATCPERLLPNAGGSGYYRWTLDSEYWWNELLDDLDDPAALTGVEAMSLIDSAFAAFEAGGLEPPMLLNVVGGSSAAGERQVLTMPLPYLADYRNAYFDQRAREAIAILGRRLYQPVLDRTAGSDDPEEQLLHSELLAFLARVAEDPAARRRLAGMAHAFTGFGAKRETGALPSDLYEAALAVAVQDSGAAFVDHLVDFRQQLDDPLFEAASATALGTIRDAALLDRVHDLALSEALGPRETFGLITAALAEPALRDAHWRWLRDNFSAVVKAIPGQWRRRTPRFAAPFCSERRLGELRALFATHADRVPGYERALAQSEESIALCIALAPRGKAFGEAIAAWAGN
ncbi:MAG: M1 family metallopeptidase [Pseudohaliea sp.]